jgi:hypothetical protein
MARLEVGMIPWLSVALSTMPVTRTALIGVEDGVGAAALQGVVGGYGGQVTLCFDAARVCLARFPSGPALPLAALEASPLVRYAEADREMAWDTGVDAGGPRSFGTAYADPLATPECPDPWDMAAIGAGDAWTSAGHQGSASPVVAIQDTGFLLSHVEIAGAVSGQYDYGDGDPIPEVEYSVGVPGHGTFIGSVLAADDLDGFGRAGVLPAGRLNLQKIADSSGALFFSYAVAAMADTAQGDLGIRVVSYSIASSSTLQSFDDAVAALGDAGILLVAAAANCASPSCSTANNDVYPMYPASLPFGHVVSVAGHLRDGSLNPYSHYGPTSVDLAAPGVDLCGAGIGSDTSTFTSAGTSYATPLVAGTAALVWGARPRLTPDEVRRLLIASVVPEPGLAGLVASGGRLSAARALEAAMPRVVWPVDRVVDRYGVVEIPLSSVAGAGSGSVLLTHDPGVELVRVQEPGWTLTRHAAGDSVSVGGPAVSSLPGATLTGTLPADDDLMLHVEVRGTLAGSAELWVRAAASGPGMAAPTTSPGWDTVGATADGTGQPALSAWVDVAVPIPTATLNLSAGTVRAGQPATLTVTGAPAGARVFFARGGEAANGACPPGLAPRCFHIAGAAAMGSVVADTSGVARFTVTIPGSVPAGRVVGFQAVVPGATPLWSEAVVRTL